MGEIKNVGGVAAGVEVQVIARDKNGRLVGSSRFFPCGSANIAPGASCGIDNRITDDKSAVKLEMSVLSTFIFR
jgi:hypothetical protein